MEVLLRLVGSSSSRLLRSRRRPLLLVALAWTLCGMRFSSWPVTSASDILQLSMLSLSMSSTYLSTLNEAPSISPVFAPQPQPLSQFSPSYNPEPSSSPLYPFLPHTTLPMVSGNCSLNFTDILNIVDRTATDCAAPFALYLGNVICCPQFKSMLHIFQGMHSLGSGFLTLNSTEANYCFSDIINILVSQGSNDTLPTLCSAQPANLTGGSCPIINTADFKQIVNVSKLLAHCKGVNPLKECCSPICQPAISEAARLLAARAPGFIKPEDGILTPAQQQMVSDCQKIVLAWLSSQLGSDVANTVLRNLFSCSVNKECPLFFKDPTEVVGNCSGLSPSNTTCCGSLSKYISEMQHQTLITNLQALNCVDLLGSMLQRRGVTEDIYDLCHVYLRDFTLQTFGSEGCLLRSVPTDVSEDKTNDINFTCDLNDDIAAPWPLSSPASAFSFCMPQVSMPALPGIEPSGCNGYQGISAVLVVFAIISSIASLQL